MSIDPYPWRTFFVLYAAGLIGAMAVIPYSAALIRPKLEGRRLTVRTALVLQFLQTTVFLGLSVWLGLRAARATGLARDVTGPWQLTGGVLVAAVIGLIAAVIVCIVDALLLLPRVPELREASRPLLALPLGKRMLAAIYGAFAEELIMRLGIFSLLVWAAQSLAGVATLAVLWTVNVIVSLLFGASHLPAAAALVRLRPMMVVRTLTINGALSLAFGFAYFRFGLLAAISSHLAADIVLQLAGELANPRMSPDRRSPD